MIEFKYNGRSRLLDDPKVRFTKTRNLIITGIDVDHGGARTFRVDRITSRIKHVVPRQRRS